MSGSWKSATLRNTKDLFFASTTRYCVDSDGVLSPEPEAADAALLEKSSHWSCDKPTSAPVAKPKTSGGKPKKATRRAASSKTSKSSSAKKK